MQHVICIDAGTQSLRAGVVDSSGCVKYMSSFDYSPEFMTGNRAEQKPESFERALFDTLSGVGLFLLQHIDISVECIAVTSQRASVIPVNKSGKPLYNALMWQDKRAIIECGKIAELISPENLYQQCGLRLDPYFSLPKMLWFKNNEPEIWKQTHKLIGVQDYLCFLLTGKYVTDRSQACRTMLLDIRNFQWNSELLNLVGIEREKLCDLCDAGGVAGEFSSPFAKRVSIPAGIPVLLCGGDQQCAALALGLFEKGTATANTGTGSFVLGYADRPTFDAQQRVLCSAAAIPGQWIVEAGIYASGATYNWCRRELFDPQHGDQQTTFETVNEQVKKVPAGSNGVLVMPHFSGSAAPNWNPLAKGIVFNLGLGSTRAEICRATLEGIAGEIADNIELIASIAGKIKCVYVAGGLTRSSEYCQIMSDNLGRVVVRRKNPEAAFMGCLMSACVTLGIYKDYREAFDNIAIEESEQFHPDPERGKVYGKARMLKRALYKSLDENGIYKMAYGS